MEYRVGVNEGQGAGDEATGVGRWHRNGLILYDHRLRAVRDDADDISTGIERRAVGVRCVETASMIPMAIAITITAPGSSANQRPAGSPGLKMEGDPVEKCAKGSTHAGMTSSPPTMPRIPPTIIRPRPPTACQA